MSRIYFHHPDKTVELEGPERAWFGSICDRMNRAALGAGERMWDDSVAHIRAMCLDARIRTLPARDLLGAICDWMGALHQERGVLGWNGHKLDLFHLQLNSALAMGGNAVKLAARLHAQCEIHAWVDGPDRAWMADIIEVGLEDGVFRWKVRDYYNGWQGVIDMLRSDAREPVVTSYSVSDYFPYDSRMSFHDALSELRESNPTLQIKPSNFKNYRFGTGISGLDLMAADHAVRLDAAYPRQG